MSAAPFEARIASLEGSYRQVSDRLNSIDRRLDGFDSKIDRLDSKLDRLAWRMTALILGSWVTLVATILLHR